MTKWGHQSKISRVAFSSLHKSMWSISGVIGFRSVLFRWALGRLLAFWTPCEEQKDSNKISLHGHEQQPFILIKIKPGECRTKTAIQNNHNYQSNRQQGKKPKHDKGHGRCLEHLAGNVAV